MAVRDAQQTVARLQASLTQIAHQAKSLGEFFERGQAECPLTTAFEAWRKPQAEPRLKISLLHGSATARKTALAWLLGETPADLPEHGAAATLLRIGAAPKLDEWSRIPPSPKPNPAANGPPANASLHLVERGGTNLCSNLEVFVPARLEALLDDPELYQQFCSGGQLLGLAWESDAAPTPEELGLAEELAEGFDVLWPLTVREEAKPSVNGPARWSGLTAKRASLPSASFSSQSRRGEMALLSRADHPLRQFLALLDQSRGVRAALESLAARQGRESQLLKARLRELESQANHAPERGGRLESGRTSQARTEVNAAIGALENEVLSINERATQPLGEMSAFLRSLVEGIEITDLDAEQTPGAVRLNLNASHLGKINRQVSQRLRDQVHADTQLVKSRLDTAIEAARGKLRQAGADARLAVAPLDERRLWHEVENLIAVGKESQIELKRRGFFDVLTAGRQKVFIIIMFVSLAGRMGLTKDALDAMGLGFLTGTLHTLFAGLLVTVFFGSMIAAVIAWQHEKKSQSEKEMKKIKENLFNDGSKVIEQVQRTRMSSLRTYLKDAGKQLEDQIEQAFKEASEQRKRVAEQKEQKLDKTQKALESRSKEVADLGRQIGKLQQSAEELLENCKAGLEEIAARQEIVSNEPTRPAPPETAPPAIVPAVAEPPARPEPTPALVEPAAAATMEPTPAAPAKKIVSSFAQRREARKKEKSGPSSD